MRLPYPAFVAGVKKMVEAPTLTTRMKQELYDTITLEIIRKDEANLGWLFVQLISEIHELRRQLRGR